jgi:hypothetical protein
MNGSNIPFTTFLTNLNIITQNDTNFNIIEWWTNRQKKL